MSLSDLAAETGLSKSAVFKHLGHRERMELTVLAHLCERFAAEVWEPALQVPRGRNRLDGVFERWLDWVDGDPGGGGCGVIQAQIEFDDQPGPARDFLKAQQRRWSKTLEVEFCQAATNAGPQAARQMAFEFRSIVLGYNQAHRLMADRSARSFANRAYDRLMGKP